MKKSLLTITFMKSIIFFPESFIQLTVTLYFWFIKNLKNVDDNNHFFKNLSYVRPPPYLFFPSFFQITHWLEKTKYEKKKEIPNHMYVYFSFQRCNLLKNMNINSLKIFISESHFRWFSFFPHNISMQK